MRSAVVFALLLLAPPARSETVLEFVGGCRESELGPWRITGANQGGRDSTPDGYQSANDEIRSQTLVGTFGISTSGHCNGVIHHEPASSDFSDYPINSRSACMARSVR